MTATPGGTATSPLALTPVCAAFQATVRRMPDAVALRTAGSATSCTYLVDNVAQHPGAVPMAEECRRRAARLRLGDFRTVSRAGQS